MSVKSYIRSALENHWLIARSFAKSECAYCLGRLVRVRGKKPNEPFVAKFLKEPFARDGEDISEFMPYIE